MENNEVRIRLDAIIFLLIHILRESDKLPRESEIFHKFKKFGFSNEELSGIFGKTTDQIAKTAYEFKRSSKAKGKN